MRTRLFHTIVVMGAALATPMAEAEGTGSPPAAAPTKTTKTKRAKSKKPSDLPPRPCKHCIEKRPPDDVFHRGGKDR